MKKTEKINNINDMPIEKKPEVKENYIKTVNQEFIQSIKKINRRYFLIMLLDLISYIIIIFSAPIIAQQLTQIPAQPSGLIARMMLYGLFLLIVFTVFQAIIGSLVLETKLTMKFIGKFLIINSIWAIILMVLAAGITNVFIEPKWPGIFIISIIFYLSTNSWIILTDTHSLRQSMSSIKYSFSKSHRIIPRYLIALLVLIILSLIAFLLRYINESLYLSIGTILFLIYLSWVRYYIYHSIKSEVQKC